MWWRQMKRERCLLLLFAGVLFAVLWLSGKKTAMKEVRAVKTVYQGEVLTVEGDKQVRCLPPSPNVFNPDAIKVYSRPETVNCPKEFNKAGGFLGEAFAVKNGRELHHLVELGVPCCFQPFFRTDDDNVRYSNSCVPISENVTVIRKDIDFIQIWCRESNNKSKVVYRDAFPLVHVKTPIVPLEDSKGDQLNIAIIALDATSHLNFQRHMPLSRDYLLQVMGAVSLEGYSILGSRTRPNLIPLLTGLTFYSFSSSQFRNECLHLHPHQFEKCPFIWKEFSKRGYLTSFAEDWANFNEPWPNAFKNPPTDYYFRPYTVHMAPFSPPFTPSHYCFGPRLAVEAVLNFMEAVGQVAEEANRPYFQFIWAGRLAHDQINYLGLGDAPLLRTLMKLKQSGAMEKTVILVWGDHGNSAQEKFASSVNGQMEYQLPVAFLLLPPWFPGRFPVEYRNLKENAKKRLTTSFDIFKTLEHLLDLGNLSKEPVPAKGYGVSLFRAIPETRGCVEAGVSLMRCNVCHPKIILSSTDRMAKTAAQFVVASVNEFSNGLLCSQQSLRMIKTAALWHPDDIFLELCNNPQRSLQVPEKYSSKNFTDVSCDHVQIIDLQLTTNPSGAVYDAQVLIIQHGRMFITDDMVRVDWFSKTGHCAPEAMKPYCICKKPLH